MYVQLDSGDRERNGVSDGEFLRLVSVIPSLVTVLQRFLHPIVFPDAQLLFSVFYSSSRVCPRFFVWADAWKGPNLRCSTPTWDEQPVKECHSCLSPSPLQGFESACFVYDWIETLFGRCAMSLSFFHTAPAPSPCPTDTLVPPSPDSIPS